jgi:hypothetical protein
MTEGVRISDLTAAAALTGVEEIAAVQSSATVKATADQIALYAREYASRVRSVSADYTITGRTDSPIVQVTAGATDRTITLPDGSTLTPGDEFEVAKVDSGAGKVTVSRAGTDTIEGETSVALPSQWNRVKVQWTGSDWRIVDIKASYDTGWVANSAWENAQFTVTHSLGAPLSDLITRFFISTDGTEANAFEVIDSSFDVSTASDRARGVQINAASDNQFTIITGDQGINQLVLSQTLPELINIESWYYKVKVRRID